MAGLQAFIGSWREEEKIGYDELADSIGLPSEKKDFFKNARTEITYTHKADDQWEINVGMEGVPKTETYPLTLGKEYKSASLDGSPLKLYLSRVTRKPIVRFRPAWTQMGMRIRTVSSEPMLFAFRTYKCCRSFKSVMMADGDKFVEKHVDESLNNLELNITRHIEGDKMIVVTKVGPLEMQSKYGRIKKD